MLCFTTIFLLFLAVAFRQPNRCLPSATAPLAAIRIAIYPDMPIFGIEMDGK